VHIRLSVPPPLPCAVLVAIAIAVLGVAQRVRPAGTTADDRRDDRIVGTISGPVMVSTRGRGALLATDDTTVWVWTPEPIQTGQRVEAIGRLRLPRGFLAPGAPDRAILAASRGAAWELDAGRLTVLADTPTLTARTWRWAAAMQTRLGDELPADDPAGAALRGIVTGDRSRIPPELDARWRIAGIYHVLSVSGLHLAVIAGLAFALLRRLVAASPWGGRTRPARWAAPLALVLAVAYTLVTGAQLATLRALLVVAIMLVAQMLDRPVRLVDALGVAAIAILVWRPADLYDPSFQLSFVAALTLAMRPGSTRLGSSSRARIGGWLLRGLATSAWVAVTTAPITALHFQQVAAGGVIGNLVLTPLVELCALPLGLAGAVLGVLGAPMAWLVSIATFIVGVVDRGAELLATAVPVGTVAIASVPMMAVLVVLSLWLASRRHRSRTELLVWIAVCVVWGVSRTPPPAASLRVTFLDVGQGDAALVELPGGDVWLVDAGGVASAAAATSASATGEAIERALTVYGKSAIDLAIVSHPHPDHYLGLASLTVPVHELWSVDNEVDGAGAARRAPRSFGAIKAALAARGTRLVHPQLGAIRTTDGVELVVWAPRFEPGPGAIEVLAADPVRSVNDNSLVVAVAYAGRTILFAGDVEGEGEEALVAAGLPHVDVVKVPHHGSPTSSSEAFVAATRPRLAVISCGVANAFGFPAPAVVARWRGVGARVLRTDADGSVTITIGADGALGIRPYRGASP
jgi:competence protein ComEC